jgi:ABC-type multidrug transport system ATPase subunit
MCTLGSFNVAILDEPFNGLDTEGVSVLQEDIQKWATEKLVLLICHVPPAGLTTDETCLLESPEVE